MAKKKKSKPGRPSRSNSMRNISRIETVSTSGNLNCGWQVRMQRRGKKYDKYFADSAHKGKRGALAAAKEYRDHLLDISSKYSVQELARNPSIRNTSGIVGVRPGVHKDYRGDYEYTYHFWIAQWTDEEGRRRTCSFSVDRWGEEEAFRRAVQARKRGLAQAKRLT